VPSHIIVETSRSPLEPPVVEDCAAFALSLGRELKALILL
jgi:hypothetical protein